MSGADDVTRQLRKTSLMFANGKVSQKERETLKDAILSGDRKLAEKLLNTGPSRITPPVLPARKRGNRLANARGSIGDIGGDLGKKFDPAARRHTASTITGPGRRSSIGQKPAARKDARRHTESTIGDPKLCQIAALTAHDVMTTLARALRTAAMLEKEGKISTEQKSQLKRFVMSGGLKAGHLIAALENGDTIKLMGILDKAKKKAQAKGRSRGVMFRENIEDVLGTADADYDRECIEVGPRVEARLPPMGPVMLRQSTYGRHQWKNVFYIFDADALLFYTDSQAFVTHARPIREIQFVDSHFVSFVSGKHYKHSGFVFSFKLHQKGLTGSKKLLKLGSRHNEDLRELVTAVKKALAGKLFARAKVGMVEEAEFIKSVCTMDQVVQHDAVDEENDSDDGNSD
jgi:hypothetical protein